MSASNITGPGSPGPRSTSSRPAEPDGTASTAATPPAGPPGLERRATPPVGAANLPALDRPRSFRAALPERPTPATGDPALAMPATSTPVAAAAPAAPPDVHLAVITWPAAPNPVAPNTYPGFGASFLARLSAAAPVQAVGLLVDLLGGQLTAAARHESPGQAAVEALVAAGLRAGADVALLGAVSAVTQLPALKDGIAGLLGDGLPQEAVLQRIKWLTGLLLTAGGTAMQAGASAAAAGVLGHPFHGSQAAQALLSGAVSTYAILAAGFALYKNNASFRREADENLSALNQAAHRLLALVGGRPPAELAGLP